MIIILIYSVGKINDIYSHGLGIVSTILSGIPNVLSEKVQREFGEIKMFTRVLEKSVI